MCHTISGLANDDKSYAEMINDISGDNPEKRGEHLAVIIARQIGSAEARNTMYSPLRGFSLTQLS